MDEISLNRLTYFRCFWFFNIYKTKLVILLRNVFFSKIVYFLISDGYFKISNTKLQMLFDYCQLLKCLRNMLLGHNLFIFLENKEPLLISWSVLRLAYENEKKEADFYRRLIIWKIDTYMRIKWKKCKLKVLHKFSVLEQLNF